MGRAITAAMLGLSGGGASLLAGESWWMGVGAACLIGVALWQLTRCRHPRPLALLPPVEDETGHKAAHWFCAACGARWPAEFEHNSRPLMRFSGHDESKARDAARRAAMLEVRSRELAVQRAGMERPPVKIRRRTAPVPIQSRRVAG
jgi:hypothetical protein